MTEKNTHRKKHIWCAVMIILIVVFDQITKLLAVHYLKDKPPVTFIPKVVQFNYAENTGMAFSLFSGARWIFVLLTLCVCIFALWYLFTNRTSNLWEYWSIGVIVAGGIGNLIDRVFNSYVIDFIEPTFMNFAIFNIADSAVTLGAASFVICVLADLILKKEKKDA